MSEIEIRCLTDETAEAFTDCVDLAFHETTAPETRQAFRPLLPYDRTAAAFDGDTLVGTSGAFPQRLSVPGGELACAGVTVVTVLPTHRRRGILTRMMARLFEQAIAAGEPVAALWAAEGGIYGRFGYGVASQLMTIELDGGSPPPRSDAGVRLELIPLDGAASLLAPVWEGLRAVRAGVPARSEGWWTARPLADSEQERDGGQPKRLVVARDGEGMVTGYALYRARGPFGDVVLEVSELISPDPEVEAALWGYLSSIDLVRRVVAEVRPVDDALPHRLADFDQARVTHVAHGLWLRLLDLPTAVAGRAWSAPADVTVAVTDARVPVNDGTWRIEVSSEGDARCTPTDRAPDLACDIAALGAAYLGGTPLTRLADAGRLRELVPGAADRLDGALRTPRAPWIPEQF